MEKEREKGERREDGGREGSEGGTIGRQGGWRRGYRWVTAQPVPHAQVCRLYWAPTGYTGPDSPALGRRSLMLLDDL